MSGGRPHVVIIGGGFGGLYAARRLRKADVRITLVDRRNHHLFQPLLYQVATAGLSAPDIASPIRKVLRKQKNCTVLLGEVIDIAPDDRQVVLAAQDGGAQQTLAYDYLIVAAGMGHNYFGHDEWELHAPGLKSLDEALEIRRRVLTAYERAERAETEAEQRAQLTFVVIGGGATGVELAGSIAEIAKKTLARDFRNVDPSAARVILVEGEDRLLNAFPEPLSAKALKMVEELGVEVRLNQRVTRIDAGGVAIGEEEIDARTVLWAAGVRGSPLGDCLGAELDRSGRVKVAPDLSVPGHPELFVVGDMVHLDTGEGELLPGIAPAAIQGGHHAADMIKRALEGKESLPFKYKDKGAMATIGRSKAIARVGKRQFAGFFAWLLWVFIHIMYLSGFRNRVFVMWEWAWAWLTWNRSARVILETPVIATSELAPGSPRRRLAAREAKSDTGDAA